MFKDLTSAMDFLILYLSLYIGLAKTWFEPSSFISEVCERDFRIWIYYIFIGSHVHAWEVHSEDRE